jgi:hypothetical protein
MSELGLAYARGAKGPIQLKQESEMLYLRKLVEEMKGERASFEKRIAELTSFEKCKGGETLFPWPYLAPPVVYLPPDELHLTKEQITRAVMRFYKLSWEEIMSERRHTEIVFPRQVAIYLCCEYTMWSLAAIGGYFGGKDHSTVLHAKRKVFGLIGADPKVTAQINAIEKDLGIVP